MPEGPELLPPALDSFNLLFVVSAFCHEPADLRRRAVHGWFGAERGLGRREKDVDLRPLGRVDRHYGGPGEGLAHRPSDVQQALSLVLDDLVAGHRFAGYQADLGFAGSLVDLQRVEAQDSALRPLNAQKELLGLLGDSEHASPFGRQPPTARQSKDLTRWIGGG